MFGKERMLEARTLLDRIVEQIQSGRMNLPVYDPVAIELQRAIADNIEDTIEIESLIMKDQALASEVLRAANSPFYCGISPVRTIRTALVRLGTQQMRRLIILVSERAKYRARNAELQRLLFSLWQHASTTALAAQWLSKRLYSTGIEEICFLGGLLHDIGKLIILRAVDEIIRIDGDKALGSGAVLTEILQPAHAQLGYTLLQSWHVPEVYCQIARDHHAETISTEDLPLAIVRLANNGSRKLGLGLDPQTTLTLPATQEANLLSIGEELLSELELMLAEHISLAA